MNFEHTSPPNAGPMVRIGIVGGGFGSSFFFHEHPGCTVEAVCSDVQKDRLNLIETYRCSKSYHTLEEILADPLIDAVALFTPAPLHAKHSIAALNAGKHVLCAVPAAMTLEECYALRDAVKTSGLIYMMAETSVYRQDSISARKFYQEGRFGRILQADASYHHPGLEHYFFTADGKPTWRHGLPPMLYATHCTAFLISVTRERLRGVSCLGWGDDSHFFKDNHFGNPFWNENALFSTSLNTAFRVSICWKGALMPVERAEWHGEKMSFYAKHPHGTDELLVHSSDKMGLDDGGFENQEPVIESYKQPAWWNTDMLPLPLRHKSGHGDSHTFITHEFIDSVIHNRTPEVDIYEALAYTAPGIVAHESALRNGEFLKIPDFDR